MKMAAVHPIFYGVRLWNVLICRLPKHTYVNKLNMSTAEIYQNTFNRSRILGWKFCNCSPTYAMHIYNIVFHKCTRYC